MISIRFSALTLSLAGLAFGLGGCERQIEGERRDPQQEARTEAAEAQKKAMQERAEAERELAEKKTEIDRDLAEKNAAIAEEQRDAEAEVGGAAGMAGMDEKLKARFDDFDRRLTELRGQRLEGTAKTELDRTIADLEKRRTQLRSDIMAGNSGNQGMQGQGVPGQGVPGQGVPGTPGYRDMPGNQGKGLPGSPAARGAQDVEKSFDELSRELDEALAKARASVKKG